jgi:hypothetical protein
LHACSEPPAHDTLAIFYFLEKETLPEESAKEKGFFSQARRNELVEHAAKKKIDNQIKDSMPQTSQLRKKTGTKNGLTRLRNYFRRPAHTLNQRLCGS